MRHRAHPSSRAEAGATVLPPRPTETQPAKGPMMSNVNAPKNNAWYLHVKATDQSPSLTFSNPNTWVMQMKGGRIEFNPEMSPEEGSERAWTLLLAMAKEHAPAPAVPDDVAETHAENYRLRNLNASLQAAREDQDQTNKAQRATIEAQAAELARYRDALDPNLTKAAYIGEISMTIPDVRENEDGEWEEYSREILVDWTAIKSVMQMIKTRAALTHPTGGSND